MGVKEHPLNKLPSQIVTNCYILTFTISKLYFFSQLEFYNVISKRVKP